MSEGLGRESVGLSLGFSTIQVTETAWNYADLAQLTEDLIEWFRQLEQQSTMSGLGGLEAVLKLLVLRRWALLAKEFGQLNAVSTDKDIERIRLAETIWEKITATGAGITTFVETQMERLESQQPDYQGLFTSTVLFNWQGVPELMLRRLVERLAMVEEASLLTPVYVDLVLLSGLFQAWYERESRSFRAVFLSRPLVTLMSRVLAMPPTGTVYDPFCGVGQLLKAAVADQLGDSSTSQGERTGYGHLAAPELATIARLSFLLLGIHSVEWQTGDSLTHPFLGKRGQLQQFERVISVFPYFPHAAQQQDPHDQYHRFPYGIPASTESDGLCIQQVLSSLKPSGRAVLLVTAGFLFRQSARFIRRGLIADDVIRTIICLPDLAFRMHNRATIPMVLLVLEKDKSSAYQGGWQLIDASQLVINAQREFPLDGIVSAVEGVNPLVTLSSDMNPLVVCWVSAEQCQREDYNLNPPLYLPNPTAVFNREQSLKELLEAESERRFAQADVDECLRRLGWNLPTDS
jgi:type I restriction enzyme M protein